MIGEIQMLFGLGPTRKELEDRILLLEGCRAELSNELQDTKNKLSMAESERLSLKKKNEELLKDLNKKVAPTKRSESVEALTRKLEQVDYDWRSKYNDSESSWRKKMKDAEAAIQGSERRREQLEYSVTTLSAANDRLSLAFQEKYKPQQEKTI